MNFKPPRDPNTPSLMEKLRDIPVSELKLCSVGSGECRNRAFESYDDTEGGEFFVCPQHLPEFHALSKLIAEMPNDQIIKLASAIVKAESEP